MKLFTIIKKAEEKHIKQWTVYTSTYIKYIEEEQEKKVYFQYMLYEDEEIIKIFDEKEDLLRYLTQETNLFDDNLPF